MVVFTILQYTKLWNNLRNYDQTENLKTEIAHLAQNYVSSYKPTSTDLKKHRILRNIRNNREIIVLKPDKGNGVVIMDRKVHKDCCLNITNDKTKFKNLEKDPALNSEGKLQRFLGKLKTKVSLDETTYRDTYPKGSQPARFYGLSKLHKQRERNTPPPFRPTVSSIRAHNYKLAKYLGSLLSPHISNKYTTQDSFSFVQEIQNIDTRNKYLISFDVQNLFTNIPLNETINIAINTIFKHNPNFPINRTDLKMLFSFATTQSHFLFNDFIYDQMDGVTMGSPLAPILANLFMGHHEKSWLENYKDSKILIYRRYVDDIFCLFDNKHDAMLFFDYINSQHPNIKFTHEKQLNGKRLPWCFSR